MADKQQNPAGGEQPAQDGATHEETPPPQPAAAEAGDNAADPAKGAKAPEPHRPAPRKSAAKPAKPAKSQGRATDKAADKAAKAPAKPTKSPVKSTAKSTAKTQGKAAGKIPGEAAEKPIKAAKAPAKEARPTEPAAAPPPAAAPAPAAVPPPPGAWMEAAWEAVRRRDQPPQRLAELAVAELGPRAAAWIGWLRETYPGAPADGIVRLATEQARRHGWTLAALGAGGPAITTLHLPAAVVLRVLLVLRIAAAYGHDPADPARAGDLLTLLRSEDESESTAGWWVPAAVALTGFGRRRRGRRLTPLRVVRALAAISEQRDGLLLLAHRATRYYRRRSTG